MQTTSDNKQQSTIGLGQSRVWQCQRQRCCRVGSDNGEQKRKAMAVAGAATQRWRRQRTTADADNITQQPTTNIRLGAKLCLAVATTEVSATAAAAKVTAAVAVAGAVTAMKTTTDTTTTTMTTAADAKAAAMATVAAVEAFTAMSDVGSGGGDS